MAAERLQKLLARAGVSSRRAAEQLLVQGRVKVNGVVVTELGAKADGDKDRIEVDGRPIAREEHAYFLLHKPRGVVTTLKDPQGRPSLGEYLDKVGARVYPVGRLDFNTSGVLLCTNDGDLAQALLHPSREVPKTYIAKLNGTALDKNLESLRRSVTLDDGYKTAPAKVKRLRDEEGHSWLEITITEGKNRQIHRMIEAIGFHVMRLSRVAFAGLDSADLRPGELRPLDQDEIAELKHVYQGIEEQVRVPPKRSERERAESRPKSAPGERAGARAGKGAERPARVQREERPARVQREERPARVQREERPARVQREERPARVQREERPAVRTAKIGEREERRALRDAREERPAKRGQRAERPAKREERPAAARGERAERRAVREEHESTGQHAARLLGERVARSRAAGAQSASGNARARTGGQSARKSEESTRTSFDKAQKPRHKRGPT